MAYSTSTDIRNMMDEGELIQATDDEGVGAVNDARVTDAIDAAGSEIDGYLGGRYPVPLSPVPPILKSMSVDMAIYHLYSRRLGVPPHRKDRYLNAVKFFTSVATGGISLGAGDPSGTGAMDRAEIEGPGRIFSRESLWGY